MANTLQSDYLSDLKSALLKLQQVVQVSKEIYQASLELFGTADLHDLADLEDANRLIDGLYSATSVTQAVSVLNDIQTFWNGGALADSNRGAKARKLIGS